MPLPRPVPILLLLPLLLGSGASRIPYPVPPDESTERWVADLLGDDRSDRTYAARVLRSRVRLAVRRARRSEPGSLDHDEALATLDTFDTLVAPACVQALSAPGATRACADLLGLLGTGAAAGPLEALLAREGRDAPGPCTRRRIARALERIRVAAPPGTSP